MKQFLTNEKGERMAVVLPIAEYEELLELAELAELAEDAIALKEADDALAAIERGEDELIPWEQIKRERRERRERANARRPGPAKPGNSASSEL